MGTDSLYYIMDYSGNYYRTDKADQLVAVAGEQDATVFTFAQANSRICVGKTIKVGELSYEGLELINAKEAVVCAVKLTRAARGAAATAGK